MHTDFEMMHDSSPNPERPAAGRRGCDRRALVAAAAERVSFAQ
jgi:hypothetical protein